MSIKTGAAVKDISDSLLKLPLVNSITSNSFYLAFAIVVIIVLIASFVFEDKDEGWSKTIRAIFWGYIFTVILLLLRDRAEAISAKNGGNDKLMREIFVDKPGETVHSTDYLVVGSRAGTLPGHSQNPLMTRGDAAGLIEARARMLANEMVASRNAYASTNSMREDALGEQQAAATTSASVQ